MRTAARALPLPLVIAWRFLSGRRSRLLDSTSRAALLATALGVMAMVIAMALMTGYREDLERKLIGGNAAVVAYPLDGPDQEVGEETLAYLRALPGVEHVGRVAYSQGSLASTAVPEGLDVTVRGVDPGAGALGAPPVDLAPGPDGLPGLSLGSELARKLGVAPGELVRLVALGFRDGRPRFSYQTLRVVGTFTSGFAEFDDAWAVADRGLIERLAGREAGASLYEIALVDPARTDEVGERVRAILGPDFLVSDWRDLNRELFTALALQQIVLFLMLGLIVLVSTFNVASTLVVLVRDRRRDVGVLAALGFSARRVRGVFLLYGVLLGFLGTALGVALGSGISWLMTELELIRFDPEVAAIYFISSVPFRVRPLDLVAVVSFTLLVTLAACWLPARRAGRINPSEALRYE